MMKDVIVNKWVEFKIKTYNFYLTKRIKRELYRLLLYKLDKNLITPDEANIMEALIKDDEIQDILDPGYTKGVDRNELK